MGAIIMYYLVLFYVSSPLHFMVVIFTCDDYFYTGVDDVTDAVGVV